MRGLLIARLKLLHPLFIFINILICHGFISLNYFWVLKYIFWCAKKLCIDVKELAGRWTFCNVNVGPCQKYMFWSRFILGAQRFQYLLNLSCILMKNMQNICKLSFMYGFIIDKFRSYLLIKTLAIKKKHYRIPLWVW